MHIYLVLGLAVSTAFAEQWDKCTCIAKEANTGWRSIEGITNLVCTSLTGSNRYGVVRNDAHFSGTWCDPPNEIDGKDFYNRCNAASRPIGPKLVQIDSCCDGITYGRFAQPRYSGGCYFSQR
ncbi:hypothetical protein Cob_v007094 [Colletotrichum orbiculare MAFF 240422]|uniref:Uncharacterized protein n=1 Tax=Colletotrichum orbiculare (strain 104-T / ATCC 96160 / CBS 514.97 / LARS 414 / MAFF 240422) TaxID=1213857 RepID=A0A484FNY5_COLOR|nr:hypothetical protein Cob_v007094 [Colletotrichum orbiculare MAFF 240422]